MKRNIIINLIFLFTIFNSYIYAHDDEFIHPQLTEQAAQNTYFKNYLFQYLNFEKGLESTLSLKGLKYNILEWLQDGSKQEDSPMCRASNHFHDPLKTWNAAAMSDSPWWINFYCNSYTPYYSNITWATGFKDPAGSSIPYNPDNEKSPNIWANARNLYYDALTAKDKTSRENNFAQMFKAIGQVMHLLQDMSVPAHVRNDFMSHLIFNGFCNLDGTCSGNPIEWFGNPFEYYIKNNSQLVSTDEAITPPCTYSRLTDFWDTNRYDGDYLYSDSALGLAEITNANYLSNNTIPNNRPSVEHKYQYPAMDPYNYSICIHNEMGTSFPRKYICRNGSPDKPIAKIDTSISVLNDALVIAPLHIDSLYLVLDDNVHDAYARDLLPLAVGYSSEILNYFFRGKMEAKKGYRNIIIKNASDETILDGIFELYYDNEIGARNMVKITDGAAVSSLEPGAEQKIEFDLPMSVKSSYMVVYKGRLGDERNAVIGKFIPVGHALIFVSVNSQCIIWDVEKNDFYDQVTTNSSTPENPQYATFPCVTDTISKWRENQNPIPTREINNMTMIPCGRDNPPDNGTGGQLCPLALDAQDTVDFYAKNGDDDNGSEAYLFNSNMDSYTNDRYTLLGSLSSEVKEFNSSIWYRVKSEGHSQWNSGVTEGIGPWSNGTSNGSYSFYSLGEPFNVPFFKINYSGSGSSFQYLCMPPLPPDFQGDPPQAVCEQGRWNKVQLMPRKSENNNYYNSAMTKLILSDNLILHITHVAAVMNTSAGGYDGYVGMENGTSTNEDQPRIQGLKVNLDYKKEGFGSTYNLGYIPVAPDKLKSAIQNLINSMYSEMGIPATETTYNVPMRIIFYEIMDK